MILYKKKCKFFCVNKLKNLISPGLLYIYTKLYTLLNNKKRKREKL